MPLPSLLYPEHAMPGTNLSREVSLVGEWLITTANAFIYPSRGYYHLRERVDEYSSLLLWI